MPSRNHRQQFNASKVQTFQRCVSSEFPPTQGGVCRGMGLRIPHPQPRVLDAASADPAASAGALCPSLLGQ